MFTLKIFLATPERIRGARVDKEIDIGDCCSLEEVGVILMTLEVTNRI